MSDVDDDISLTSTVPSEGASEYEVASILAEREGSGDATEYLVHWDNYGIESSTWEPVDSFNDPDVTLADWEDKKRAIAQGKRQEFDVPAFEKHVRKLEQASADRKRKRAAKRRRLGYLDSGSRQTDGPSSLSPGAANSPETAGPEVLPTRQSPRILPPDNSRVKSVADKPPMAVFGKQEAAHRRIRRPGPRKPVAQGSAAAVSQIFNLSTKRRHEKAKHREPAPNVNQLDLRRPSEWSSRTTGATMSEDHAVSSPKASEPAMAASRPDEANPNPYSARPAGAGNGTLPGSREFQRPPRLPPRVAKPGHFMIKGRFLNSGEILIHMFYGRDKTEIGSARICGLPPQVKQRLVKTKTTPRFDMWFQHLCTFHEYDLLQKESFVNRPAIKGWIEGFDDTEPMIYDLGEMLRKNELVGILYPDHPSQDVLLVYSPRSPASDFLADDRCPNTAFLSIAVRNALAPITRLERGAHVPKPANFCEPVPFPQAPSSPAPLGDTPPQQQWNPVLEGLNHRDLDALFKSQFKITFNELATAHDSRGRVERVFYLMFPNDSGPVENEYELVKAFLKSDGRDPTIYTSRDPEDWKKFTEATRGIVLFHQTFVEYHTLRYLQRVIRKPFAFWTLSLAEPLKYADRPVNFQRIFPHGCVILLTEDFMMRDSDATVITLAWFKEHIKGRFPGNWKLMLRPGVLDWLLKRADREMAESRPDKVDKTDKAGKLLVMYRLIMEINTCGHDDEFTEYGVDNIYHDFDQAAVISPPRIPNYGNRRESPDIPKGRGQVDINADHLIEYFAGWALANCHKFRRFTVATTIEPIPRWESWNHLEIRHNNTDFLRHFDIDFGVYWHKLGMTGKLAANMTSRRGHGSRERDQRNPSHRDSHNHNSTHTPRTPHTPHTPHTPNLGTPTEYDASRRGRFHGDSWRPSMYPQTYR